MSAENLFEGEPVTSLSVNDGNVQVYAGYDLPKDDPKKEQCLEHFDDGRASALVNDFLRYDCQYPKADQEQIVGLVFKCPGASFFSKRCRLNLDQHGPDGKPVVKQRKTKHQPPVFGA